MDNFDNKQICSYKDIDRFGFTCDVCGRKVNGCHYINGMSFCEKCYQETFGKDNQQNEIQQLKQQLDEKDKEIERLKERLSVFDNFKDNYGYTNYDDSEILEDLQSRAFQAEDDTQVVNELLQFFNIFDENELVDKVKEPQTQLAIQELEKVKIELKNKICLMQNTEHCYSQRFISWYEMCDQINKQIKELKGEK